MDTYSLTCTQAFLLTPHTPLLPCRMSQATSAHHTVCCPLSLGERSIILWNNTILHHTMQYHTIPQVFRVISLSQSAVSSHWGKRSVIPYDTTSNYIIAYSATTYHMSPVSSAHLLSPLTDRHKCYTIVSHHATTYHMSTMQSACHKVCCLLLLEKKRRKKEVLCHMVPCHTTSYHATLHCVTPYYIVPYHTFPVIFISTLQSLLYLSLEGTSVIPYHTTPYYTSYHTMPYSSLHRTTSPKHVTQSVISSHWSKQSYRITHTIPCHASHHTIKHVPSLS